MIMTKMLEFEFKDKFQIPYIRFDCDKHSLCRLLNILCGTEMLDLPRLQIAAMLFGPRALFEMII